MEGFGEFNLVCESSEGNGYQRARQEARENRSGANEILEVTYSDRQEIIRGASSSSHRGQKQRHTRYQIQELENIFRGSPHPDERERLEIGRKLNLEPNQVKFWFQNRRTQQKTQTDRHDNRILKQENEKLRLENIAMRDALQNSLCKNCGGPTIEVDRSIHERNLMTENARLREELNQIKSLLSKLSGRLSSSLASSQPHGVANPNDIASDILPVSVGGTNYGGLNPMDNRLQTGTSENNMASSDPPYMPACRSEVGVSAGSIIIPDKTNYLELASSAMDELMKLVQSNAPLWNRNMETGGENLNFNAYSKSFPPLLGTKPPGFVSEASRATGMVSLKSLDLVEALLDADRWREMFVGMIGSSATMEVIFEGNRGSRNGVLQLMKAEIQFISPSVAARVMKFIRFTRKQAEGVWAVVDLSIDVAREGLMCRRLPSGCILHDLLNGFSKVTWGEHTEYDERPIHLQYRRLISSGFGFGAQKWISALLRHCECSRALSSPTINYQLPTTTRSFLKGLARRMTNIFCAGVCLTSGQRWNLVSNSPRIMTRRSMNGGEPSGTLMSATISVWIPTTHRRLFDLLLNKDLRCMWDVLCHGHATGNVVHFPMTHDDNNPNSISLLSSNTDEENPIMLLQETTSDMTGSLIVYATVDLPTVSALMNDDDTSSAALLPSGLYIVPGYGEHGVPGGERGSMVTVGFHMLLEDMETPDLITMDTINTVNNLVSRTVLGIKELVRSTRHGG